MNQYLRENFLNDKKWNGKGKEYDSKGKIIFEGKYVNGKKNGNKREYDYYGKLSFEGEYLNDEKMEVEKNIIGKEN